MNFISLENIRQSLHPRKLFTSLTAGLVIGIILISFEISLAVLIYSGPLASFVSRGIGFMLFGTFITLLFAGLISSLPGTLIIPQDTTAAILALIAGGIAAQMAEEHALSETIFITVVTGIILTSLLAGVAFFLLGSFKLSGFVRFIPYPVVGGFLAGTGWLLAKGAMNVMTGLPMITENLGHLFQTDQLLRWVPGLLFAIVLLLIMRRSNSSLIIPGMLALAIVIFYLTMWLTGTTVAEASANGWLVGPFPAGGLWQPIHLISISTVDWSAIFSQIDKIGATLLLGIISLLLNTSGLEVAVRQDIDMNRELQSAGVTNVFASLVGSTVSYQTLSLTTLVHRMDAKNRLTNIIAALICGGAVLLGASLLSYFPKPVLGGLLMFLGLSFLVEWVIDARTRLPQIDYLLVLAILAAIATIGFLEGVGLGILAAVVMFVVSYSRINAVKNTLTGLSYRSKVERPAAHRSILQEKGDETFILTLQGFIFFGTAQKLLDQIKARLAETGKTNLRFIVFDFRQVVLLDSSAVFSLTRMKQLAESQNIKLLWTHLSPTIERQLELGGLLDEHDGTTLAFPSIDHGVEWCENQILAAYTNEPKETDTAQQEPRLEEIFSDLPGIIKLKKYLDKLELNEGDHLMYQGEQPCEMYFIGSGLITAQMELQDGQILRLRSMRAGTTVGEMGLYLGNIRAATVIAAQPSIVYRLSKTALKKIETQDAELAAALHEWIARLLAERLADNSRTLEALLN